MKGFNIIYLFWLLWVITVVLGFLLGGGKSVGLPWSVGFSLQWHLLQAEHGLHTLRHLAVEAHGRDTRSMQYLPGPGINSMLLHRRILTPGLPGKPQSIMKFFSENSNDILIVHWTKSYKFLILTLTGLNHWILEIQSRCLKSRQGHTQLYKHLPSSIPLFLPVAAGCRNSSQKASKEDSPVSSRGKTKSEMLIFYAPNL